MLDHHVVFVLMFVPKRMNDDLEGKKYVTQKIKSDKESGDDVSFLTLTEHSSVKITSHYQN